jgi:hypothetical protein
LFDVLIVGSGSAGVAAGLGIRGGRVGLLDVGLSPPASPLPEGSFYDLRAHSDDLFEVLLGKNCEGLCNLDGTYLSPKLKAPGMRYITGDWQRYSPVSSPGCDILMSFAQGGLANSWGAGVYRYNDEDLWGFPISASDLKPYYDRLTEHLGISGRDDDLSAFFGPADGLLPPLDIDEKARYLLSKYEGKRGWANRQGLHLGFPRLAVLSRPKGSRPAYQYSSLEFFTSAEPSIYTPRLSLEELIREERIEYLPQRLVRRFKESDSQVEVSCTDLKTGRLEQVCARRLVLAAGPLNTARIVLESRGDNRTALPLLDNPISYIPFLVPRLVGRPQDKRFFAGVQLNLILKNEALAPFTVQGSCYGMGGVLRSDIIMDFPFAVRANILAGKFTESGLTVLQLFYPDDPSLENRVQLDSDGTLQVCQKDRSRGAIERYLIRCFRKFGHFSIPSMCRYPRPGNSFHYAGCLPMRETHSGPYETDSLGRLSGNSKVFVADASVFPRLPAKNHTFTVMALAMRVGEQVSRELS